MELNVITTFRLNGFRKIRQYFDKTSQIFSHERNLSKAGEHQIERRGIPVGSEHSNAKDGNQYVCVHGK
jgi:hypothetical protein